jgi:hypothetical protein
LILDERFGTQLNVTAPEFPGPVRRAGAKYRPVRSIRLLRRRARGFAIVNTP